MRQPYSVAKILALIGSVFVVLYIHSAQAACGYDACPKPKANMLNVHLVPHSHDDVGWLKTVDEYYYGSKNYIQRAGVQYILDNVVEELSKNSERRFIEVESAFFFKWYEEQDSTMKSKVKKLINNGQLEIAGGAWSMNDEAAVHYQSVIDQFSLGLKSLDDTFGTCARPRIGWQIDPFGHSREMASIFAQMGYDGEFFARIDEIEKNTRLANLTAEMLWKSSEALGASSQLFTGLLYNHYSSPPGFCFDDLCSDEPFIDDNGPENNVQKRVNDFLSYISKIRNVYRTNRTNNVMVPFGDDFQYMNAGMNFKNMDKLIKYVNARQSTSKVNIFYSTPSCYLKSLHEAQSATFPEKIEDFFPYASDNFTYWTGYFTSRPTQKRFERDANHFLQVTKQLTTLAKLDSPATEANLNELRKAMGVMQHHDAITGTEKQAVAYNYDFLVSYALSAAQNNTRLALQKLTNLKAGEFVSCLQRNISVCEFTQRNANNLVVTLYNPLSRLSYQYVRIPVKNAVYEVTDELGVVYPSQLVPVPREVLALPYRANDTQHELVFQARVVNLANYFIRTKFYRASQQEQAQSVEVPLPLTQSLRMSQALPAADIVVSNSWARLTFDSYSGLLTSVQMNGVTESIRQEFLYYKGYNGNNNKPELRASGAYIFRPNGTEVSVSQKAEIKIFEGNLVKEVHQRFNSWISQVIRIHEGVRRVEFEWMIGPIPIEDGIGKEVITRFTSNINSAQVFYTDSNGREMLRRLRDKREYFKPNLTEHVSANYYPITSRIAIEDGSKRLALLTDRAQGGTSMRSGVLELMLHRRLLRDDAKGVGEALNETAYGKGLIARGKTYLILNSLRNAPTIDERIAEKELHLPFWQFYSRSQWPVVTTAGLPNFDYLPKAVHLLTMEPFGKKQILLRFEHYMDRFEAPTADFNIRSTFDHLGGEKIEEYTLDGVQPLDKMKRMKFVKDNGTTVKKPEYWTAEHKPLKAAKKDGFDKFYVTLKPMQIRTFVITTK